jgi:hypothetical protein
MRYERNHLNMYHGLDSFTRAARIEIRAGFWRSSWRWFVNTPPLRKLRLWNALTRRRIRRWRERRRSGGSA